MTEDTCTQDVADDDHGENVKLNAWGNMQSIAKHYPYFDLIDDHYTVGRQGNIVLTKDCAYHNSISKIHFEIKKDNDNVMLIDRSANGTFVDGVKVGKNNSVQLHNESEIALCVSTNSAFTFINLSEKDAEYPSEVNECYKITKKLGSGAYGEVKLAFRRRDQTKLAVKIIDKKTFSLPGKANKNSLESEVAILKKLDHPCVIKFFDAIDTGDKLFIFMELVEGGELFDRVINIKQFQDADAKVIFYQMVLAIKYLHDNNICHRDLKPENILLNSSENCTLIKVSDFGLSKFLDDKTVLKTMCGTPNYLAPEVLLCSGSTSYTAACDVWSLGVILFIILVGYPPFSDEAPGASLREQILNGSVTYPTVFWKKVNKEALDLVKRMLLVDPSQRISIKDILCHPWLSDPAMLSVVHGLMYPGGAVAAHGDAAGLTDEPIIKRKKVE